MISPERTCCPNIEPKYINDIDVPKGTPLLLNDVSSMRKMGISISELDNAIQILIIGTFKNKALFSNTNTFSESMRGLLKQSLSSLVPNETAIIFPGQGAKTLAEDNDLSRVIPPDIAKYNVSATRNVNSGKVLGVTIGLPDTLRNNLQLGKYRNICVIDDVVGTGSTLNTLKKNLTDSSKLKLKFLALTWFCRKPTEVDNEISITSLFRYWTKEGFPALNSISTWLKGDAKSEAVLTAYKKKYVQYSYGFDKQLQNIKDMITFK